MKSSQKYFNTALSNCLPFFAIILMLTLFATPTNANSINAEIGEVLSERTTTTACFSVANNGHALGEKTIFVNESVDANTFFWDFGDGNFSTDENPSHLYQTDGTFTVRLIVTGAGGTSEFIGDVDVVLF